MSIIKLTDSNFEEEVLKSDKTVLVDFYADWCGPCRMQSPILDEISEENDIIKVAKVNVDECPETSLKYDVMGIPTLLVIKGGEVKQKFVGVTPKEEILNAIK